jgi:hypothetical protein
MLTRHIQWLTCTRNAKHSPSCCDSNGFAVRDIEEVDDRCA